MTSQHPEPPFGVRPPMTVEEIATTAAVLIARARDAGLTPPCSLNCHDYGAPAAYLFIAESDVPDVWDALLQWASHYGTEVAVRQGSVPESVYASAEFRRDGIRYEVHSVIHRPDDDEPDDWSDDEPEQAA
jgi:hypothetical protein